MLAAIFPNSYEAPSKPVPFVRNFLESACATGTVLGLAGLVAHTLSTVGQEMSPETKHIGMVLTGVTVGSWFGFLMTYSPSDDSYATSGSSYSSSSSWSSGSSSSSYDSGDTYVYYSPSPSSGGGGYSGSTPSFEVSSSVSDVGGGRQLPGTGA